VSPDSGAGWTEPGAWKVSEGVYRIPLPLPNDGLRAVNVYALETDAGLTLVDGGWAIPAARSVLDSSLRSIGYDVADIRSFLVTHMHRDHYSMASFLALETGATTALGKGEHAALEMIRAGEDALRESMASALVAAGAEDLARLLPADPEATAVAKGADRMPDRWLDGRLAIPLGERVLDAVPTPGHTPGHYVFVDHDTGSLFAGDHLLPTITPSIGFTFPLPESPLADFLTSLATLRPMPDLTILPAHGPVAPSSHARIDELLAFHEERLQLCGRALGVTGRPAAEVAATLPWTRHQRAFAELDPFNRRLAVLETRAHLEVLVSRGQAVRSRADGIFVFTRAGHRRDPVGAAAQAEPQ
jgi:glyoxylase-like metal-dependent hydrolase (beta-lactamase superfamily II)